MKQPSLLALRAFEAAARRLSFTEAARELHVSQAAISRHIRGLEQDLAQPLFRRRFSDHSLALDAARRGQGVVLGTELLIESQLAARELAVIGRTRISLGGYWLLQASDRATAKPRAAFTEWLAGQIKLSRSVHDGIWTQALSIFA